MEELRLDGNAISFVPDFISKLEKLKVLDLSRNDLLYYPSEFDIGLVEVSWVQSYKTFRHLFRGLIPKI